MMEEGDIGGLLDGRYRLERIIGEGAMARTWLAVDLALTRELESSGLSPVDAGHDGVPDAARVAVKELPLSRLRKWKDLELFRREAEMLTLLEHPGIPRCYDYFLSGEEGAEETFYLVEEWVDGESLQDQLERRMHLPEREVRRIMRELLEVLHYLHTRDVPIVHRDIKPSNVMVRPGGQLVLIDFGAVRELLHDVEDGSTIVGTFGYMPPEQLHGRASAASDIYALAATACHLLTGVPPRDMPLKGQPFMLDFRPHGKVSDDLAELLESMLQPEIDERLWDVDQVLDLLEEIEATAAPAEDVDLADMGDHHAALAAPQPGPRSLTAGQWGYAMALPPVWRYLALIPGLLLLFTGPLGWLISVVTFLVAGLNLREGWANAQVLTRGTIIAARVAAKRPARGGVELEYGYKFKRRSYMAAIVVRASLLDEVEIGSVIQVAVDPKNPEDSVPLLGAGRVEG